MKALFLFSLLLVFASQSQNLSTTPDDCPVTVAALKWIRTRQIPNTPDPGATGPAAPIAEVNAVNKPSARKARANDPAGARDPTEDSIDSRSSSLEKTVQESRAPKAKLVDGFNYQVKVHNTARKGIDTVFWEYQFIDWSTPANVTRRQFVCDIDLKPDKDKELQVFSLLGPSDVINVQSLANAPGKAAREQVIINRIEFRDGSYWQRKDWNVAEIKQTYHTARATPWAPGEMCRGL